MSGIPSKEEYLQLFFTAVQQAGLDGKLSQEQLVALFGVCDHTIMEQVEPALVFLKGSPDKQRTLDFYSKERSKQPIEITANIDTRERRITIGKLTNILFNAAMWEVSKTCRLGGHFMKLDLLAKYYAQNWGSRIDGTLSTDADLNSPKRASGGNTR